MTTALIKLEKHQLAAMDTATLVETIDRMVKNNRSNANRWRREAEHSEGDRKSFAIAKLTEINAAFDAYMVEQQAMFESKGLDKYRAFDYAIVPTGETAANGSEIMRIVKRGESLRPVDDDDDVTAADERAMSRAPSFESDEDWEAIDGDM